MDSNKHIRLYQLGYRVQRCCELCQHADIDPRTPWGTCKLHSYEHVKHAQTFQLSIHRSGICANYEPRPDAPVVLGGFADFFEGSE